MIKYKTYKGETIEIEDNFHNKGALSMLELISNKEGWEESQDKYIKLFFNIK